MAVWIPPERTEKTTPLLVEILRLCKEGHRVQFLTDPGMGSAVVQRLRVALSRSRQRNINRGRKVAEFTLCHSIHPFTDNQGKRHDAVVMWTHKTQYHVQRELLDDLLERGNVAAS